MQKRFEDHPSGKVLIFEKYIKSRYYLNEVERELKIEGDILLVIHKSDENFHITSPNERKNSELQEAGVIEGARLHKDYLVITKTREHAVKIVNRTMEMCK